MNPLRKDISVESQIQKRKGKRFETEFQNLTMQMIQLMTKYFSNNNTSDILETLVNLIKLEAKVAETKSM